MRTPNATASSSNPPEAKKDTSDMEQLDQWDRPPDWIMFLRRHIWKFAVVFGIVMLTGLRPFLIHRPPAPEIMSTLPEVQLVDENGQSFSRASMREKVWIVGFIFTRCPTVCPRVTQAMVEMQEMVRRAKLDDRVSLLSVTVDPEYDTPRILHEYANKVGVQLSNWHFVGGSTLAIREFVSKGFMLDVGQKRSIEGESTFDISHSTKLALVDAEGNVRGYFSTEDGPEEQERLFQSLFPVIRLASKDH